MTQTHPTTRIRLIAISLAVLALTAGMAAPVAADDPFDGLWDGDDEADTEEDSSFMDDIRDRVATIQAWGLGVATGLSDRVSYEASNAGPWADAPDLDTEADATAETLNANDDAIVDYLNEHTDAGNASVETTTVHELRLVDTDHAIEESVYIAFDYDQEAAEWTAIEASRTYDGDVDREHRFSGFLAEQTSEEAERFVTDSVAENRSLADDSAYTASTLSRYGGIFGSDAQSTLLDDGFEGFDDEAE